MPLDIREHPTWVPTVHTLKTVADLRDVLPEGARARAQRQNKWLPDLNQDGSNDIRDLAELKERLYRIQDTNGDGVADTSKIMIEGFNADPTYDIAGALLYNGGDLLLGTAPGVWRLKDENNDGTIDRQIVISEGYSIHPAFGGHGISGLTIGPDGRIYWEVGDIGLDVTDKSGKRWSYPNQGAVMRSEPDGSNFEVFADRHPQPAGVLLRRVRQPDQRRQRRRSSGRDRASRLHPERIRQRLALELAVRQVHRREEQPLQRLDGREDVQAAVRRPGGAHRPAGGGVSQRSLGHGLQPGYRAFRRVEKLLLRLELSRRGGRRPHLWLQAEGRRRRVRARGGQGRPARHPDRRA